MTGILKIVWCVILVFSASMVMHAQSPWSQREVNDILPLEGRIVVATSEGVVIFLETGDTWIHQETNHRTYADDLLSTGDILLAASWDGLYSSSDMGQSWTRSHFRDTAVYSIVFLDSSRTLVVGTGKGVFFSKDGGRTWSASSVKTSSYAVAANGSHIAAATQSGLVVSSDGGETWVSRSAPGPVVSLVGTSQGFMLPSSGAIYRSVDQALTWQVVDTVLMHAALFAQEDGIVFRSAAMRKPPLVFGSTGDLRWTADLGLTWSNPLKTIEAVRFSPVTASGSRLFAGTSRGDIVLSSDSGRSWIPLTGGIVDPLVSEVVEFGGSYFAGTMSLGIFRSEDGATWTPVPGSARVGPVTAIDHDERAIYVGTYDGYVWESLDRGSTWESLPPPPVPGPIFDLVRSESRLFISVYQKGVFEWNKEVDEWTTLVMDSSATRGPSGLLKGVGADEPFLFIGTFGDGIHRLPTGGKTGISKGRGMESGEVTVMRRVQGQGGKSILVAGTTRGLFRSVDLGETWSLRPTPTRAFPTIAALAVDGSFVVAGGTDGTLVYSRDAGDTWNRFEPDSIFDSIFSVSLIKGRLVVSTLGSGMKAFSIEGLKNGVTSLVPADFLLEQNYPNPFNAQTTIRFDLPKSEIVRLEIFDMVGRRVETLVDGTFDAGVHGAVWNASSISTGVYFYRLTAGSFTAVKKMLLLK